jgi:hypothetical protein
MLELVGTHFWGRVICGDYFNNNNLRKQFHKTVIGVLGFWGFGVLGLGFRV